MVKPAIRNNVNFKIKIQFMREIREDTFLGNKNDDAHEQVERVLDIISLFNTSRVTHDAVMLRVFPITLTSFAKIWFDRIPSMDHSEKWHDGSRRTSNASSDGIAVGCKICKGTQLDKDCPLNEEVKGVKKVKYGEVGRSFPSNGVNGTRYRTGLPLFTPFEYSFEELEYLSSKSYDSDEETQEAEEEEKA
ncbi:hypothetical protein Tco_0509264 [Tanacetum coccineum]